MVAVCLCDQITLVLSSLVKGYWNGNMITQDPDYYSYLREWGGGVL